MQLSQSEQQVAPLRDLVAVVKLDASTVVWACASLSEIPDQGLVPSPTALTFCTK